MVLYFGGRAKTASCLLTTELHSALFLKQISSVAVIRLVQRPVQTTLERDNGGRSSRCVVARMHGLILAAFLVPTGALAQQAATAIGTSPGSAARIGIRVERVPPPKPTCESAGIAATAEAGAELPDFVFSREGLLCVQHGDGRTELVRDGLPWSSGVVSSAGDIAYWVHEKSELHVFSPAANADTVIDTLPGAMMREIVWSRKGRTLVYFPAKAEPAGIRVVNLDSGQRNVIAGHFVSVVKSPDSAHVTTVGWEGVQRVRVADGQSEELMKLEFAVEAAFSQGGRWLGVKATPPADPTMTAADSTNASEDDDSPDCTGGSFALTVLEAATKRLVKVPFPKGFDTVLDFEFSPDERAVAVTFGVTGCDYPGEAARVFVAGLDDLKLTPISPENKLSVEAHWSPDGKKIVYLDYTGSDAGLVVVDLASGRLARVTNPGQLGPDKWLAWR